MPKDTMRALEIPIFDDDMKNKVTIGDKSFGIYLDHEQIQKEIQRIAELINERYANETPLFVSILNGSFMFTSDLLKRIEIPCQVTFLKMASYEGTATSGQVKQLVGLNEDIRGRRVIVLEDIVDTGLTMRTIIDQLTAMQAASVEVATLLFKPEALKNPIDIHYVCFEIPEKFVVGYGLDLDGIGRNLPHIYQLI